MTEGALASAAAAPVAFRNRSPTRRASADADVTSSLHRTAIERPCAGHRLKPEALAVKVRGRHIGEVTELSIEEAAAWFRELPAHLTDKQNEIARRILKEVRERLTFLENVGVGYLQLDRAAKTLSGGEAQRLRLATQIGSQLVGVLYILDEPSIGLHQRDNGRLIATLERLRETMATAVDWPQLASEAGYSDQSHLARDFRRIGAASPTEYLRRWTPDGTALLYEPR